jgi:hypothetical protein
MKLFSCILIITYLLMPAFCFGHPCELFVAGSQQIVAADTDTAIPCHDTDDCETTCCCAGQELTPMFSVLPNIPYSTLLRAHTPILFLPQVLARIIVPPQNLD